MHDISERGGPSGLRGRLSDVYLPALVSAQAELLRRRLGDRATVDDPIFGRANGPALAKYLEEVSAWLSARDGAFERLSFVAGSDRDVTEGALLLTVDGKRARVPIAVVAERRPEREVEIRLYYSTKPIKGTHARRSPVLPQDDEVAVPPPVAAHLDALARGDLAGVLASLENGATVSTADGRALVNDDGGDLRAFYERVVAPAAGIVLLKGARADDGRTCALEFTAMRLRGKDVPPQAGLAVYERGDSGLLRALRLYHDIET